jgi:phage host-nuclease inhibitor protein Gam
MAKKKTKLTEAQARETLHFLRIYSIALKRSEAEKAAAQQALDDKYKLQIEEAQEHIKRYTKSLEEWAEANPDTFAGRKSLEWTDGTIGFRLGQPTLTKARTVSWETVLDKVGDVLGHEFIRITSELDKRAIIDQRDILKPEDLDACHIAVVQEERFFVEPKTTEETQP